MLPIRKNTTEAVQTVEAFSSIAPLAHADGRDAGATCMAGDHPGASPRGLQVAARSKAHTPSGRTQHAAASSSGGAHPQRAASKAAPQADAEGSRIRRLIHDEVFSQIDPLKAVTTDRENLEAQIKSLIKNICDENRLQLTAGEEKHIADQMLDEMLGVGPIEPLLADDTVNDILVNGYDQVFVERFGKLELTPITFIDEEHVFNTAQRIAARVGRRIDEANPMVDARLEDGSRVNVITHPLALDGTTISIRKFARRKLTLESLAEGGAMSMEMASLLRRAMEARLNIVVSGGYGRR